MRWVGRSVLVVFALAGVVGVGTWLHARPALWGYAAALLGIVLAVALGSYLLAAALRIAHFARVRLRAPRTRRAALRLAAANGLFAGVLLEECVRLGELFWLGCALVPAGLSLLLMLRLRAARRPARIDWARGSTPSAPPSSPPQSFPEIHVTATERALHAARSARASVPVDLGTWG